MAKLPLQRSPWIFEDNNIDVRYLIAGKPKDFEKSARLGSEDIFVIEADEYDTAFFDKRSKFIHYKPDTLILNNLEFDHADIFPDISYIFKISSLTEDFKKGSTDYFPNDDSNISKVLEMGTWSKLISYDVNSDNKNSVIFNDDSKQTTYKIDQEQGRIDWRCLVSTTQEMRSRQL